MKIAILGLSITSSWGNGHATTYRALLRELHRLGHQVLFLEYDKPWYARHRDLAQPPYCEVGLYGGFDQLRSRYALAVANADCVIVGSYVPEGIAVAEWATEIAEGVTAFYDIDTPVTLAGLKAGNCAYLSRKLIPRFDLYLSFTGGPTLRLLEKRFGARRAEALYCSVDPEAYRPLMRKRRWKLGYLGTFSPDRDLAFKRLLLQPAIQEPGSSFAVAGPLYPETIAWPGNVTRIEHLPPLEHCSFYNSQDFTLNLTRAAMSQAGYSPSVRLFEAAACGTPIISDEWDGLDSFFECGSEILIANSTEEALRYLRDIRPAERIAIGMRARRRVLKAHTAAHRARQVERLFHSVLRRDAVAREEVAA